MMNIDPHVYNITIRRDTFEGEVLFEARVKELPDVAEYGETYDEAYSLALDTIETAAEAFLEQGRAFPQALAPATEYSGRITLRLPRSLHRALAESSEAEGVSLNQYLVNLLSYFSGFALGQQAEDGMTWRPVPKQHENKGRKRHLRLVDCQDLQAVG